ncbi:MAG: methyltransferase domain-containing protein [Patescibacteria group bacterium]|nr:methyltransferase domain-containing protein [Patescibacteria group bacterium]MDE1940905.1 methyltransferase domain-containing protein [Patescibacteria group bacterium]MDE1966912.1 methyltransferase domain-containing protein [Patescibacteria group bacterium]
MKDNALIDYYDRLYSQPGPTFKGGPSDAVIRAAELIAPCSTLDLGAGEGRNAIYLARAGFDVTAVDFSEVGLRKLQKEAKAARVSVRIKKSDVLGFEWDRPFRLIVCAYVMHHIGRAQGLELIEKMKRSTERRGLNVIAAFTTEGDFFRKDPVASAELFYPKLGELDQLYSGWEIEWYFEGTTSARKCHPDGTQMQNVSARLIARKP